MYKPFIDPQLLEILLIGIGLFMSVIGFFIVRMLNTIDNRLNNHAERLKAVEMQSNDNTSSIKQNSERDREFKDTMEKREMELKLSFKESMASLEKKFDTGFHQIATSFKSIDDNFKEINREIKDLLVAKANRK